MRVQLVGGHFRILLCFLAFVVTGCGGGDAVKPMANLVPCEGTITLDGEPLTFGTVIFAPTDIRNGQSAVGAIASGRFKMVTTASAPGVVIGRYRVRVDGRDSSKPTSPSALGAKPEQPATLVPEKYASVATSGLEVEVLKGMPPVTLTLARK